MRNIIIFLVAIILALSAVQAQDWGEMIPLGINPPPDAYPGIFNPSYCDAESLLYFDTFYRLVPYGEFRIYVTRSDGDFPWLWSDPIELPEPINITGYSSFTPHINAGGDSLFFCSNMPGTRGGMDIWLTIKVNNEWNEPINLGDSINTEADELGPYYASQSGLLFFERFQNNSPLYDPHKIMMSEFVNGEWQRTHLLPEIINLPNYYNYGPCYDEVEHALYFTNVNHQQLNDQLKKSVFSDGVWQDPIPLSDNVNGFWYPNYCNEVTTENACLSYNRRFLFYDKWIWEQSICIDFESILFVSVRTVGIEQEYQNNQEDVTEIAVYPNPSNTSFTITANSIDSPYDLTIYNMLGEVIRQYAACTDRSIVWNGSDSQGRPVASGVYLAKVTAGEKMITRKLVLQK